MEVFSNTQPRNVSLLKAFLLEQSFQLCLVTTFDFRLCFPGPVSSFLHQFSAALSLAVNKKCSGLPGLFTILF